MAKKKSNVYGVAGLVVGAVALLAACPGGPILLAIAGIGISIIGLKLPQHELAVRGLFLSIAATIVSAAVLICAAGALSGSSTSTANPARTQTAPAMPAKFYNVGQSARAGDVTVTFLGWTKSTGSAINRPHEGNLYLLCEFDIENNSNDDITVSSILAFSAYVDDYLTEQSMAGLLEKGSHNQLDGTVAAGRKMNGVIAYEVPEDWDELEIQIDPAAMAWPVDAEIAFRAKHR